MVAQYFDVIAPQQIGSPRVERVSSPVPAETLVNPDPSMAFGGEFDSLGALAQQVREAFGEAQLHADQDLLAYGNSAGAGNEVIGELESPRSVVMGASQDTLYPTSNAVQVEAAMGNDGLALPFDLFSAVMPSPVTTGQPLAYDGEGSTSWLSDGDYSLMGPPSIYLIVISPQLYDSLLPTGYSLAGYGYGQARSNSGQYLYRSPQSFISGLYGVGTTQIHPDFAECVSAGEFQRLIPYEQGDVMPQQQPLLSYADPSIGSLNSQLANYAMRSVVGELLQQAIAGLASGSTEVPLMIKEPRGDLLGGVVATGS